MENITTTDLAEFGARERWELKEILESWEKYGLPTDFIDDEVVAMMNKNSFNVFLTNADYQVAMLNGDKLESFYSCPQCGHEGFLEDMEHNPKDKDCQEYLKDIKAVLK